MLRTFLIISKTLLIAVLSAGFSALVIWLILAHFVLSEMQQIALMIAGLLLTLYSTLDAFQEERRRVRLHQDVTKAIKTLAKQYRDAMRVNEYGQPNRRKWHAAIDRFLLVTGHWELPLLKRDKIRLITDRVKAHLKTERAAIAAAAPAASSEAPRSERTPRRSVERSIPQRPNLYETIARRTADLVQKASWRDARSAPPPAPTCGHAFEAWCAARLQEAGWRAEVTGRSGDDGIDVIARKDGVGVGLQCKRYSSAVGNRAVQEAHTGKSMHRLDHAAVVSTAGYTTSAEATAKRTGVLLLSERDLPKLAERLGLKDKTARQPALASTVVRMAR
ncbi:MAG: restriction endonuclease [Alphaproteobacteria bacterium GM202ARS2]|nr:restriction endonuclease [Alphaproteobacteria bacterium GM202ARS2]